MNKLFIHSMLALGLAMVLLFIVYLSLSTYTNHGQYITVPDLKGKTHAATEALLAERKLKVSIADSIFMLGKVPGSILDQDPLAGSQVKEGRTIYVTINSLIPPNVKMPDLHDVSLRQAQAILTSYGLKTGTITYRPDLAKDAVLEQRLQGQPIARGVEIPKASAIDLVLGDGLGNTEVELPDLIGLTHDEAIFIVKASGLVAQEIFDTGAPKATATIYRQQPSPADSVSVHQGQVITIYLK
ncbi:MAG: hypothetical protein RIQ89_1569 [Bacteroidota bacterium]|jgi:beta-lactam-binding protein with PASTA domain